MRVLIAIAALVAPALAGVHADEWRPYTANPKYEVFGSEDARGVFVYTAQRKVAARPTPVPAAKAVVNYGLDLAPPTSPAAAVSGTDLNAGRELAERVASAESAGHRCDDERVCPRPKPRPAPEPSVPHPFRDLGALPHIGLLIALAVVIGFGFLVVCLMVLALVIWARKSQP